MTLELIKDLIASEIGYWNRLRSEATAEERIKIDGAISELMMYAGFPGKVDRDYLAGRFTNRKARSKKHEIKNRELDIIAMNRAVKACEAIVRLGKKVSEIDKTAKRQHSTTNINKTENPSKE